MHGAASGHRSGRRFGARSFRRARRAADAECAGRGNRALSLAVQRPDRATLAQDRGPVDNHPRTQPIKSRSWKSQPVLAGRLAARGRPQSRGAVCENGRETATTKHATPSTSINGQRIIGPPLAAILRRSVGIVTEAPSLGMIILVPFRHSKAITESQNSGRTGGPGSYSRRHETGYRDKLDIRCLA